MTEITLCGYCVELPEKARSAARQVSRCPLCKADLGVTGSSQRFRITDAPPAARSSRGRVIGMLLLVAVAATLALAGWTMLQRETPVAVIDVPPAPTMIDSIVVEAPEPPGAKAVVPAAAKGNVLGVLSPDARAKADGGEFADTPERVLAALGRAAAKPPAELPDIAARRAALVRVASAMADDLRAEAIARQGERQLLAAPEVTLMSSADMKDLKNAKQQIAKLAKDIIAANGGEHDGFIRSLQKDRADLAGLPFRLGKDCELPTGRATELARSAAAIRTAFSKVLQPVSKSSVNPEKYPPNPEAFWYLLGEAQQNRYVGLKNISSTSLLPALTQILGPEAAMFRLGLIERYRHAKDPEVTHVLTRLALFDPEPSVRSEALLALYGRPPAESTKLLLEALRYPWAPVAQRAADAMVSLQREDLVPQLVDALHAPDPTAPFEHVIDGKRQLMVRELVKVNHHKNCLLCHAPAGTKNTRDVPLGAVPAPGEPLPPPVSTVYYSARRGTTVVRADITYLRQDFSMLMRVERTDKRDEWPEMQRFDFLIRTRVATDAERQRTAGPAPMSPQRLAVLSALRTLTRMDAGDTAAAWREAMAAPR
jgi:hypothetical protein